MKEIGLSEPLEVEMSVQRNTYHVSCQCRPAAGEDASLYS